jgi:hypothetical protein
MDFSNVTGDWQANTNETPENYVFGHSGIVIVTAPPLAQPAELLFLPNAWRPINLGSSSS